MKKIHLALKENAYDIVIGNNLLTRLGKLLKPLSLGSDAIIISSSPIYRLYGKSVEKALITSGFSVKSILVPDGEKSKSSHEFVNVLNAIARYDEMKKVFVVAVGGGVVGDLAGFVAAVYKRGVPYVQVPTTFLAQIDSSIGGKVAIDLPVGKNLVGAFHQPKIVVSDVAVLKTLDKRQMRNGLAEAVKYGVIRDAKFYQYLEKNYLKVLSCDATVLSHVVGICSQIKADVVMADEKETKGIRTILNYGHTAGHAIEAAGGFDNYHHGEAVALGMRVAGELSVRMKLLNQRDADSIENLLSAIGLPKEIQNVKLVDIMRLMKHDKKFVAKKNRFVLAHAIGKVCVKEGIDEKIIVGTIKKYLN